MKIKHYVIIAAVLAVCATAIAIFFSGEKLRHEFAPINVHAKSFPRQEFEYRFHWRGLTLIVERSNKDKDVKGKDAIVFTVKNWKKGIGVDTKLLNQKGFEFQIKRLANDKLSGETKEIPMRPIEHYLSANSGYWLICKYEITEDMPKTIIPIITLTNQ